MGEHRDKYSGKKKAKGVVCPKTEEWPCPAGIVLYDTGSRDDLKNQEFLVLKESL